MKFEVHQRCETTTRIVLTPDDVRAALRMYLSHEGVADVHDEAELYVHVPTGGDFSGCILHLHEAPLIVKWTDVENSSE